MTWRRSSKAGKEPVDAPDRPGPRDRDRGQVLFDGEGAEDVALLGRPANSAPRAQVRRKRREILAAEGDSAAKARRDADQRIDQSRLADAVASKQRQRLAVLKRETHAMDDPRLAIAGAQAFDP